MVSPLTLAANPDCNPACRVCHYKELDYPAQLARKQAWAEAQLGQWQGELDPILPAPEAEQIGYRSKSWLRSSFSDGALSFGMVRAMRTPDGWGKEFIDWDRCPLHLPALNESMARAREVLVRELPEFVERALVGIWVGQPHWVIVSREEDYTALARLDWQRILTPPYGRVWFHCNPQTGRKIFGHREIRELTPGGDEVFHPIRAFRQVAQSLLKQARARAVAALMQPEPELVVDLYCGSGDLSLLLPPAVAWLGIETSSAAVGYAKSLRPTGQDAFVGLVEQRLRDPRVLERIRGRWVLYLNPPRSGLSRDAQALLMELIARHPPRTIVYLSCSASSLRRDLEALSTAGYSVESLQPYDFFPQTEHFETLAVLTGQEIV